MNKIKHIINEQGQFLSHNQLKDAYNINTPFLTTIQIRSSIPKAWKEILRKFDKKYINISSEDKDIIHLVNKEKALDKITCADFYWHLIETKKHKPNNINKWCEVFQDFEIAIEKSWHRIFKLQFVVLRNTKI